MLPLHYTCLWCLVLWQLEHKGIHFSISRVWCGYDPRRKLHRQSSASRQNNQTVSISRFELKITLSKRVVLPLHHMEICTNKRDRTPDAKFWRLPLYLWAILVYVVTVRFELTWLVLQTSALTNNCLITLRDTNQIRTDDFTVLQTVTFDHSAIVPYELPIGIEPITFALQVRRSYLQSLGSMINFYAPWFHVSLWNFNSLACRECAIRTPLLAPKASVQPVYTTSSD